MRLWVVGGVLIAALAAGLAFVWAQSDRMRAFPTTSIENARGYTYQLPRDFQSRANIVTVAFDARDERALRSWDTAIADVIDANGRAEVFRIQVMGTVDAITRFEATTSARGRAEDEIGQTTYLAFEPKSGFASALGLPDSRRPYILVVDQRGMIRWWASERATPAKIDGLNDAVRSAIAGGAMVSLQ